MPVGPDDYASYVDSVNQYGLQTAPAAGAVIADSGQLMRGIWQVNIETSYGGTADVIDNMELWVGGAKRVQLTVIPVANAAPTVQIIPAVRIEEGQRVQVKATAAGAVNTVYRAVIRVTPLTTLGVA